MKQDFGIIENKCDEEINNGFEVRWISWMFLVWILFYWITLLHLLREGIISSKATILVGLIYTLYMHKMFEICRPFLGILLPMILSILLLHIGLFLFIIFNKNNKI